MAAAPTPAPTRGPGHPAAPGHHSTPTPPQVIQPSLEGLGYGSGIGLVVGGMLTGGLGAVGTLGWMMAGSLVGGYLTKPYQYEGLPQTKTGHNVSIDLYYSKSMLGHFTLIVSDKINTIVHRIHFVDRDAEAVRQQGKLAWAKHKLAQVTGFAKGRILENHETTEPEYKKLSNYGGKDRSLVGHWDVSYQDASRMLDWAKNKVSEQNTQHFDNYSYFVYSNNVDNCGSFALKCLSQAGISTTLPTWKSYLPLPSVIKDDVQNV